MRRVASIAQLGVTLISLAGCLDGSRDAGSDRWEIYSDTKRGYSFQYPSSWTVEQIPERNAVLVASPTVEHGWRANLFFEVGIDEDARSLELAMHDMIPNLKRLKNGFQFLDSDIRRHPSQMPMAVVNYTQTHGRTRLTESEVIIVLGDRRVLFVGSSAATSTAVRYGPIFQRIIDSVRKL